MTDYSHKQYAKVIWTDSKIYEEKEYVQIHKDDVVSGLGAHHHDFYRTLTESIGNIPGCLLPKEQYCPSDYLSAITRGRQKVLFINQKAHVTRPKNLYFTGKYVYPAVSKLKTVLEICPQRWHRTGPLKGHLILEDIDWVYTVFATVEPIKFAEFEKNQWDMYHADLRAKDPNYIQIPIWLKTKIDLQQRIFTLKGKLGRIVANKEKANRIKRKRMDALRDEINQNTIDDQVFLPNDDINVDDTPTVDKKFVPIANYNKSKTVYNQLKTHVFEYNNNVMRVPYDTAMQYQTQSEREQVYNKVAYTLQNNVAQYDVRIPSFEEACLKYTNNN